MLTPKAVSEHTGITPSTLRRWSDYFAVHLAPRTGKKRMYTTGDLATFMRIRDYAAQGMGLAKIKESLYLPAEPANQETALITITDLYNSLEFAQSVISSLNNEIKSQSARLTALEEYIALPWYKRIGKQPPTAENNPTEGNTA